MAGTRPTDTSAAPCISRRAALSLGAGTLISASLAACGSLSSQGLADLRKDSAAITAESLARLDLESKKIACWGDSLTKGIGASEARIKTSRSLFDVSYLGYPEMLEKMTGLPTFNYGVSGADSNEIVAMMLDVEPPKGVEMTCFSTEVAQSAREHPGKYIVIEMGSNGGWEGDFDTLIAQYHTMISASGCEDYLIIGDTDDPGTSIADTEQKPFEEGAGPGHTQWERAMRAEFGRRFINMRRYLIYHGLKLAGLEETDDDRRLAQRGCVSPQLRSDWTHLNSYGYYVQAYAVYRRGIKYGMWEERRDA